MEYITLRRAEELSGISKKTLRHQVGQKKLHAVKLGHDWLTTRVWLHEYVMNRDTRGHAKPLPADYVAPE